MEITGMGSALPYMYQGTGRENIVNQKVDGDKVDVRQPQILADDEVDGVLNDTIAMIGADGAAALSVHSGLSASRAYSLLGL